MSNFNLKHSKEFYLELTSPVRFDAVSQLSSVFYDDTNSEVFTVQLSEVPGVSVSNTNGKSFSFCLKDKATIISIKFSPDHKVLAIQSSKSPNVSFLNFNGKELVGPDYTQSSKWKNTNVLGFVWPRHNEIAIITDHGLELLHVISDKRTLKTLKTVSFSASRYCWCAQSKTLVLVGHGGAQVQPFSLAQPAALAKMPKLDLEGSAWGGSGGGERDVYVVWAGGVTWCAVLRQGGGGGPTDLCLLPLGSVAARPHTLHTGLVGRFAINVLDHLLIVHHQSSRTSLVFDIEEEGAMEKGCVVHVPLLAPRTIRPFYIPPDKPCSMYSGNWVVFQPDVIIDAKIGYMWQVSLNCSGLAHKVPKQDLHKIVAVLLRREGSEEIVFQILNQVVTDAKEYLSELTNIFDEINSVYRKWADQEMARQTGLSASACAGAGGGCDGGVTSLHALGPGRRAPLLITQADMYSRVLQLHDDDEYIVQVMSAYMASLCACELVVSSAVGEAALSGLVRRGRWARLRQAAAARTLPDSRALACLLLALAHADPACDQLALDMMHRLNAHQEIVEVLVSRGEVVAGGGAARQAGGSAWAGVPARKLLAAAVELPSRAPFRALYHALSHRNTAARGSPHFTKGEQCDSYVQHYQNLARED